MCYSQQWTLRDQYQARICSRGGGRSSSRILRALGSIKINIKSQSWGVICVPSSFLSPLDTLDDSFGVGLVVDSLSVELQNGRASNCVIGNVYSRFNLETWSKSTTPNPSSNRDFRVHYIRFTWQLPRNVL